jgi:polysaccharide biosynthesis transport protein
MNKLSFSRHGGFVPMTAHPPMGEFPSAGEQGALPIATQYLRIAFRWRWLILGAIAAAVLIGVVVTLLATPQYTAVTRLEINREGNRIVQVEGVTPETQTGDLEFYQTQYGLLKSDSLAERVARQLRLQDNRDFFAMFGEEDVFDENQGAGQQAERLRQAARILLEQVAVNPLRLSRLVDVKFTSPDASFSARVANAWATSFIEFNIERRFEATAYARRFLEQRLGQLRQRLESSERELVGYASDQAIINIPIGGEDDQGRVQERSLTADTLAALNAELSRATADRVRAESRLKQAGGMSAEAVNYQALGLIRERRAEAAAEYSKLLQQFEPGYPAVQAAAAEVRQLDASIAREEARISGSLQVAYQDAARREKEIAARVESLKQNFLDQRRRSIQYNIFQREVDTNRELYNGLLQRYKEIGVAGGVGENNIAIVDKARVPDRPSRPRPLLNLALSLIFGGLVGVGLALIREQIDETITDPTDIERSVGLPLLGAVPKAESANPVDDLHDPKSALIEAYLSVQTSLAFSTDHGVPRTVTVTSTRPAEGKSTTSYALAYVLARNGSRVILVDGDMRSPSVHDTLGLTNERGLSSYLTGTSEIDQLVQKSGREPFQVMAAGPQPPNAAELLRSDRFNLLLQDLLKQFDHVVIDSPPVMGLADAPIIASRTEGTVFVVEARGVKARIARVALGRLSQGKAQLLGTVLTKFDAKGAHFGYGYDYGYGYGSTAAAAS